MTGRRKLTDEQLEQVAAFREEGKSLEWISQRFDLSTAAVRWQCLRLGADTPDGHLRPASKMPMVTIRNGHVVRRFTPTEDARLLALVAQGANRSEIARQLGRKPNSVLGRLMTIGMNEDRRERADGVPA